MLVIDLLRPPRVRTNRPSRYPYYDHLRYRNCCDAAGQLLVLHHYNQVAGLTVAFGCEVWGRGVEWRRNGISKKALKSLSDHVKIDLALAGIAANIIRFDLLNRELDDVDRRQMMVVDGQRVALEALRYHTAPLIQLTDLLQNEELRTEWCAARVERVIELLTPYQRVLVRLMDDVLPRSGQHLRVLKSASDRIEELISELMFHGQIGLAAGPGAAGNAANPPAGEELREADLAELRNFIAQNLFRIFILVDADRYPDWQRVGNRFAEEGGIARPYNVVAYHRGNNLAAAGIELTEADQTAFNEVGVICLMPRAVGEA